CHFMGFEVIHNHDIARTQLGNQDLLDIAVEHIPIRAAVHGHRRHEAVHTHRANQRHGLTPIAWLGRISPLTTWCPSIRPGHIDMTSRFIDKDQLLHLRLPAPLLEGGPSLASLLGVLFGSMERLFFRVSPSWSSARYMVVRPTCTRTCVANCSQ